MRHIICIAPFVLTLCYVSGCSITTVPIQADAPLPPPNITLPPASTLTGVVLDRISHAPLANATITVRTQRTHIVLASLTTRYDGSFHFTAFGNEPVEMITEMPGYQTAVQSGFELRADATTRLATELYPVPITLPEPASETWDLAALHGTLSGYRGDGARDVEVILVGADTRIARTDEQGRFQFTDVLPGQYTFVAQKPGFEVIEHRTLSVTSGDEIEVQFTLEPENSQE